MLAAFTRFRQILLAFYNSALVGARSLLDQWMDWLWHGQSGRWVAVKKEMKLLLFIFFFLNVN